MPCPSEDSGKTVLANYPSTVVRASPAAYTQSPAPSTIPRDAWWPRSKDRRAPQAYQEWPSTSPTPSWQTPELTLAEELLKLTTVKFQLEGLVRAMADMAGISESTVLNVLESTGFLAA